MWWDIHQGICCCSWCPGDVWDLSSKNSNKSRNIIVLTFTKPFRIGSSITIYIFYALRNPPCQAQHWILQQLAAQNKHTYTAECTVWCSCWNSDNRQSPSGPPYTLSTDVRFHAHRNRDAKAVGWLTLLSECVAGGNAVSVGDHTGEDAQILQGGTVEDGSGPEDGDI